MIEVPKMNVAKSNSSNSLRSSTASDNGSNSSSSGSLSLAANPGELNILMEALEVVDDVVVPLTKSQSMGNIQDCIKDEGNANYAAEMYYGTKAWRDELNSPSSQYGLIRKAIVVPDEFIDSKTGKLRRGLNPKDFSKDMTAIKPRRASLPIKQNDFFSSLHEIDGRGEISNNNSKHKHYIFYDKHGLNGWPSLRCFELLAVEERRGVVTNMMPSQMQLLASTTTSGDTLLWKKIWENYNANDRNGNNGNSSSSSSSSKNITIIHPQAMIQKEVLYRVTLRASPWTSYAWAKDNPGFVFWYESLKNKFNYGLELTKKLSQTDICTDIHMVSHRYVVGRKESPRDRVTYHSFCVLDWDHGQYCTVIELAYLNGLGGYQGKCNFFEDRDAPVPNKLYALYPPELIQPWSTDLAEIRAFDVKARNFEEFKDFIYEYSRDDDKQRFIDPQFSFSHPARLTMRTKAQIARYLINYITRDDDYEQLKRNCQTFAADLCAFIAGKKTVLPYHPIVSTVQRLSDHNKIHYFMYDSYAYHANAANSSASTNNSDGDTTNPNGKNGCLRRTNNSTKDEDTASQHYFMKQSFLANSLKSTNSEESF